MREEMYRRCQSEMLSGRRSIRDTTEEEKRKTRRGDGARIPRLLRTNEYVDQVKTYLTEHVDDS